MEGARRAVFLSYAREDASSAQRIAEALRSQGVEVWFDQNELRGGDAWDQKLRRQIKECSLFMPVISAQTQERPEGYFRLEWKLAIERTHLMLEGMPFLAPVVVDDTPESRAAVPAEFMKVQWTRLAGALPTTQFVEQIKRLLEAPHQAPQSDRHPSLAPSSTPPPASGTLKGLLIALAAIILVLLGYLAIRPSAQERAGASANLAPTIAASTPSAASDSPVSDKSIAVLPFVNMSEAKENGFFSDGVHEDILTDLALIPELKVVSRTTVMRYRDSTKSLRQIGEELGVAYILEGSVRRAGNKVRVTGQLINARTDDHVWAKNYDRDLTDIFVIQADLAQEIASSLAAALSPQVQHQIAQQPTDNLVAYDFFLKGRDVQNRAASGIQAPLREAESLFKSAVEQDPKFAAAWGELAVVHALHIFWELDNTPARLAQGDAAISRALELAPHSPDIINSAGTYVYYAHRDYAGAGARFEQLARLTPNDPTLFNSLALIQRRQGQWAESLMNERKAVALDPGNVSYARNLETTLEAGHRWDEAIAAEHRVVALLRDDLDEQAELPFLRFEADGSRREWDEWLGSLSEAQRESRRVIAIRQGAARTTGDCAEAVRLDRRQPYFDDDGAPHWSQSIGPAIAYVGIGDLAGARARLGTAPDELRLRLRNEPTNSRLLASLALMEAILGHNEEASRLIDQVTAVLPVSRDALDGINFSLRTAVQVHAYIGKTDQALAELAQFMRAPGRGNSVASVRGNPWLKSLHGNPRFEALLADPKNQEPLF